MLHICKLLHIDSLNSCIATSFSIAISHFDTPVSTPGPAVLSFNKFFNFYQSAGGMLSY